MEIENTGVEIATSSLNITFASAVPKSDRIKIYPNEVVTADELRACSKEKFDSNKIIKAGIQIQIKFPKAIANAEMPCNLYLIKFTLME